MYAKHIPVSKKVEFPYQKPQLASGSLQFEPKSRQETSLPQEVLEDLQAFATKLPEMEGS